MFHVMEIPWEERYLTKNTEVKNWRNRKVRVVQTAPGKLISPALIPYMSQDYSFARWQEDELNKTVKTPEAGAFVFKPYDYQKQAAAKILNAYSKGQRGFLEADKMGLGKTLSTLVGICAIAQKRNMGRGRTTGRLLIVCPKSVIPQWRQTLRNYPAARMLLRPLVINYQQLSKLMKEPKSADLAKKQSTKNRRIATQGESLIDWDFVVFDEAHYLKNYPSSNMSVSASRLAKLHEPYVQGKSPFTIFVTATPGATPLNLALMSGFIAPILNPKTGASVTPQKWPDFLIKEGFSIEKQKSGYVWTPLPWRDKKDPASEAKYQLALRQAKALQRKDSVRIGRALTSPDAPFIMRNPGDIAGWPEQKTIPYLIAMSTEQVPVYQELWTRFRKFMLLPGAARDPKTSLVENLRYRQKSSLMKVEVMAEQVADWVDAGNQVYVSVEFMETADRYMELLMKRKVRVVEMTGRNVEEREPNRLKFQRGEADVVICSVTEGVSFHAGETLPDGTKATMTPRMTVIHDVRARPETAEQSLGRAHRDGQNSLTYFPVLADTVDEVAIGSYISKLMNMKVMTGNSGNDVDMMEQAFRVAAASLKNDGNTSGRAG